MWEHWATLRARTAQKYKKRCKSSSGEDGAHITPESLEEEEEEEEEEEDRLAKAAQIRHMILSPVQGLQYDYVSTLRVQHTNATPAAKASWRDRPHTKPLATTGRYGWPARTSVRASATAAKGKGQGGRTART
ncbi:uncharacterized protein FIBRA_07502 [Fibroporia radiculosa]|uniref:Uncharacterized protein n=1 Tax=Fibroporia radiculosa TaxID=599839 RepID=J4H4N3_9APHY|nr:uncharacterized protein FIBRA_07502 [Fibroporia radiculosa]CCM05289.1 predicted protein [Fibroporia radiculosa]